jgi:dihydrodipicolinate synthase/N-acetylneuraminate lyase
MTVEHSLFGGVAVALATLFGDDGALDARSTADLACRLVDDGLRAIVVAGTTGEASKLSPHERLTLLEAVQTAVGPQVAVLLGTGNLEHAHDCSVLTAQAGDAGAHGVLVLAPHGCNIVAFYTDMVAAAGPMPVLAYHHPEYAPPGIDLDALSSLPTAGLKDSSGQMRRLLEELDRFPGALYTGSAALAHSAGALGATGAILAAANLDAPRCIAAFQGDATAQRALLTTLRLIGSGGAGAIKAELNRRHGTSTRCR